MLVEILASALNL